MPSWADSAGLNRFLSHGQKVQRKFIEMLTIVGSHNSVFQLLVALIAFFPGLVESRMLIEPGQEAEH